MKKQKVKLGISPREFPEGAHLCLIYKNEKERREIMARFLASGISDKERVAYFTMKTTPEELLENLKALDIDITGDDLEILDAMETYCLNNEFDPERMLLNLKAFYNDAMDTGHKCCRVSGEMDWALKAVQGTERLLEYEALVNDVVLTHPVTAICQYDAREFSGQTILECLKVHPFVITNGQVLENPYYLTPREFLQDYGGKT